MTSANEPVIWPAHIPPTRARLRSRAREYINSACATLFVVAAISAVGLPASANEMSISKQYSRRTPLILQEQGSFFFGGKTITGENGDTIHVEHAFAHYQIPTNPRKFPLVMWHGGGQSGKTWEMTPDGREGYQQIFSRRGYPVYIIDQAGRGRGGRLTQGITISEAAPSEANLWNIFRIGPWLPPSKRGYFPGVQFSKKPSVFDQYEQQALVSTGPEDRDDATRDLQSNNMIELFKKTGPGVLMLHSNSGQYSWRTGAKRPDLVKGIVAYEPDPSFAFPSDKPPQDIPTDHPFVKGLAVPQLLSPAQFKNLTKMPIIIIYGDNIEFNTPSPVFGVELWRVNVQRAKQFVDAVNNAGGSATLVFLPKMGIKGNTHFPFSDLNNVQVADHLSKWLKHHRLDVARR